MTAKEKAKELVDKFYTSRSRDNLPLTMYWSSAVGCALIAVDEILKSKPRYPSNVDWDDVGATHQYYYEAQIEEAARYWEQVKQEIEKL